MAKVIETGELHTKCRKGAKSAKRCASTAIRFTTSPIVDVLRAEFEIRRACNIRSQPSSIYLLGTKFKVFIKKALLV